MGAWRGVTMGLDTTVETVGEQTILRVTVRNRMIPVKVARLVAPGRLGLLP